MGLQDAWRKAAALLIEAPTGAEPTEDELQEADALIASGPKAPVSDTERLLARADATLGNAAKAPTSAAKTVEQIVRDADGPNLDEIARTPPDVAPGKAVAPSDIYTAAKLPATPFGAEQMLEMLQSLPAELPLETRRATVKVTLGALGKTVGATPETIAADASRKMAALAAYSDHLTKRTEEMATREAAAIAELQKQIEAKKQAMVSARQSNQHAMQMCQAESERLHDVLEFFSLDVAPSKLAPDNAANTAVAPSSPAAPPASGAKPNAT